MLNTYKLQEDIDSVSLSPEESTLEIREPALNFQFIIDKLLTQDNSDEDLIKFSIYLEKIELNYISETINTYPLSEILEGYRQTQNIYEEKCFLNLIEFFSMFESKIPNLMELHFFVISIEKIQIPSPNSCLILKILSNIFPEIDDKDSSLNSICALAPVYAQFEDPKIFEHVIQFIYNYSANNNATQAGAASITEFVSQLFVHFPQATDFSTFSIERLLWIFAFLFSKFQVNLDSILSHPLFSDKANFFADCPIEITIPFLVFTKHLFEHDLNPFDIHIPDIIPFISSENPSLVSSSLFLLSSMLNFSDEMQTEFQELDLNDFEKLFSNSDYNNKLEYSFLFQHLFHYIRPDDLHRFFTENADFIFDFLWLNDETSTLHVLKFMNDLFNDVADTGTESFTNFIQFLIDHDFPDILEENALNSDSEEISLFATRLLDIMRPQTKEDFIPSGQCVFNITSYQTPVTSSGFL